MNPESQTAIEGIRQAGESPAAKFAGISGAIRLLLGWMIQIEKRLEALENGSS